MYCFWGKNVTFIWASVPPSFIGAVKNVNIGVACSDMVRYYERIPSRQNIPVTSILRYSLWSKRVQWRHKTCRNTYTTATYENFSNYQRNTFVLTRSVYFKKQLFTLFKTLQKKGWLHLQWTLSYLTPLQFEKPLLFEHFAQSLDFQYIFVPLIWSFYN